MQRIPPPVGDPGVNAGDPPAGLGPVGSLPLGLTGQFPLRTLKGPVSSEEII